jgi:hypothetical protein
MKEQLLQLYNHHLQAFRKVVNQFPQDDLNGPFLMSPGSAYFQQPSPLLVIGQETNGWSCFVEEPLKQMETYEKFAVGQNESSDVFWSMIRKTEALLGNEPFSCAWTNFSKFDLYGLRPHGKYEKAIASLDNLLVEEIKILQPEVCLFFTGPYFDNRLRKAFGGMAFENVNGWDPKQLCRLRHESLPFLTFRSYHPWFLKLKGLDNNLLEFISNIKVYNL